MQRSERFSRAGQVMKIGFVINAILMAIKLLAGHFGRSEAVFADGIESACDFIAILTTMFALHIGRMPYDESHPYGHGKAESIAAIFIALVIIATGGGILVNSVKTIVEASYARPHFIAVAAALATILIKEWLYRSTHRTGKLLDSPALLAVAHDHRKDALTSIGTLIGVSAGFLGLPIMDPIAAAVTSILIFHIGYQTFRNAIGDLMDVQAPREVIVGIIELAEGVAGVEHVHEIRGRRSGQYLIIDLKLEMDPDMSVKESHAIATNVKRMIFDCFPNVGDVMIHINPHEEEHEDLIRL